MLFRQFVDDDLGCASYLIGDEKAGEAVVVDPAYAIEPYLQEAGRHGLTLCCVLETHTHADHVSGHGRLALEHGVPIRIHSDAEPDFPFEPLVDGTEIQVGDVSLTTLHTPGHRPEHCCFAVTDHSRAEEPWLVLTGDSLLVGDAARPDLAVQAQEGAQALFHSLQRLLELPDGVEVYPGHVAGSLCGAGMSSKPSSTVGFERRFNRALGIEDEFDFVAQTAAVRAARPPNLERIVELNRGQLLGAQPPLEPTRAPEGATVLDVRQAETFAQGHVERALNVPLEGSSFATKAAFILSPGERVVLHAGSPDEARRAARGLNAVGIFELAGFLEHSMTPARLRTIDLPELRDRLEQGSIDLIDVREKDERDDGYIPGSRNIPYRLVRAYAGELAGDRPVATICESGARAAIAASVLAASGIDARPVLHGGVNDWEADGRQTVKFRRCGN